MDRPRKTMHCLKIRKSWETREKSLMLWRQGSYSSSVPVSLLTTSGRAGGRSAGNEWGLNSFLIHCSTDQRSPRVRTLPESTNASRVPPIGRPVSFGRILRQNNPLTSQMGTAQQRGNLNMNGAIGEHQNAVPVSARQFFYNNGNSILPTSNVLPYAVPTVPQIPAVSLQAPVQRQQFCYQSPKNTSSYRPPQNAFNS